LAEASPAADTLAELYHEHYRRLVRLAWLLIRDAGRAEEIVQDAFVDLHGRLPRLDDPDRAAAYLRVSVVNRVRSSMRHLRVVQAHRPDQMLDVASAESGALERLQQQRILACLNELPRRQREVLVLRYYGQLSEAEIAEALGISKGAVKSHASRGLHALRPVLQARS
jgi:RNA polymerase sigma-70 factor (sigma-E family)